MKKLNVGIIGFGLSGKTFHSPLIKAHPGFEIKMVSSSRPDDVKSLLPSVKVVASAEEMIRDPELDVIINCAPNSFHYSYSAMALENNKHVVVEKPFVNTVAEGKKLIALAREKNKILTVFQNRRWDSDFLTLKKIIASGKLGEIKQFESHFDRFRPEVKAERWREQPIEGSGILYDLGAHVIDQALQLFGMPEKIMADVDGQKSGASTDDYFHIILYYKTMRAILHSTSFASSPTPRFQIFGEKSAYIKFGLDPQEQQLKDGLTPEKHEFGLEAPEIHGKLGNEVIQSERGRYMSFYEDFYHAITQNPKYLSVQPSESLEVMKLIELAIESSKSGRVLHLA